MSQTTAPQILDRSVDRRRHLRQKVSSITYLEFGDDNGGILLNLAGGGLSVQAVAKLNPGQELTLRFGLFNGEDAITVAGRVIWVSATRKEAGICFVGLSESAGGAIDKWVAAQEAQRTAIEWKTVEPAEPEPAKNEIHLLPQLSAATPAPKNLPAEPNDRQIASIAATTEPHLADSLLDHATNRAKTSLVFGTYVPSMMPTRLVSYPKEQPKPDISLTHAPEAPHDAKQPIVRPFRALPPESSSDPRNEVRALSPSADIQLTAPKPGESPIPNSSVSADPIERTVMAIRAIFNLSSREEYRRTMQILLGVAACLGILLLLFIAASLGRHPADDISSAPLRTPSISSTLPVSVAENSGASPGASNTTSAGPGSEIGRTQTTPELQINSATVAATGTALTPEQSSAPAPIRPPFVQQRSDSSWLKSLRQTFLGIQEVPTLDPAVTRIPVWADQRTGFYYCDNGPYFVKPERVSLLTQGEALQSGFQPKLGTYCY